MICVKKYRYNHQKVQLLQRITKYQEADGMIRAEYPRPQFVRNDWLNLNGEWEFEIDHSVSGKARGLYKAEQLKERILIPFCPESKLSGVGFTDFMDCVWYRKEIELPTEWIKGIREKEERIVIHFGAVDYKTTVYINGKEAAIHVGGYSSFQVDITEWIDVIEKNVITLCVEDDVRSKAQPAGKQSAEYESFGCFYTRTTGIWQTVWLERLPKNHIASIKLYPDVENTSVRITAMLIGNGTFKVKAFYDGKLMGETSTKAAGGQTDVILPLTEKHLWEVGKGRLYDLELEFEEDKVSSYFGLRSIKMDGLKFLLNGKSVFQRLVLDQGFYPDGIYTAPTEEALIKDIEISMAAGFNGARLHQKVFEPRFLYHCDRLGYMVWGEHANWGMDTSDYGAFERFIPEWIEIVERDFNHPSIVVWCPFNETWNQWNKDGRKQLDFLIEATYRVTKLLDYTRPCVDSSGSYHVKTDIFDLHDYDQNPETFKQRYDQFVTDNYLDVDYNILANDKVPDRQVYRGEPVCISEYGGIKWDADGGIESWGYGDAPKSEEEFIARYRELTNALLQNEKMFGFCYTQLYDVEQEKNGLYTYERVPKFDMKIFKEINTAKAAIED